MKKLLLFTLFPFFQQQNTLCTLHQCEVDQIVLNVKDETQEIQLFNIQIHDYRYLCQTLQQAQRIEMVTETNMQNNQVYLWVDGELLQTTLLSQGYASLKIANPTYLYGQEMIDASRHIRKTQNNHNTKMVQQNATIGIIYYIIVLVIWLICIILLKKRNILKKR